MKIFFLAVLLIIETLVIAADPPSFSCKYRYTWQKDSTNINSKANDIMILTINGKSSLYYSYLKHLGYRNLEKNINETQDGSGVVNINSGSKDFASYYTLNESEVIKIDFAKKSVNLTENFIGNSYGYNDTLIAPKWKIGTATATILNQKCQMATSTFKGRNYTAWFAVEIPYNMGPWLFNGLPGLILKVSDDKGQFLFECIELNTTVNSTKVFKPYSEIKNISKAKLRAKKRLFSVNQMDFQQAEFGANVTVTGADGKPMHISDKPYNPIDLTK